MATAPPQAKLAAVEKPDDHLIVLFGATGDLARRKLLPGLFHLEGAGLMPERYRVVGTSRDKLDDEEFRALARQATEEFGDSAVDDKAWRRFAASLSYVEADDAAALAAAVERAEEEIGGPGRRLHYLSVPPGASAAIGRTLADAGLIEGARVIMEKPFGTDLDSARALNADLHEVFDESQIYRIDHFLGKEAVQNLLALRFANGMFEPVWNRDHIDHVQIDVPETLSIGTRGEFYEQTAAFRDMIVTHLFQVLGFVAMEPPTSLEPKTLVDEKVKVFHSLAPLRPEDVVRGQYEGYRDEEGVAPDSQAETFVAVRASIDNWRWSGVPFYLRTGKCLAEGRRMLTIAFRQPPRRMFSIAPGAGESLERDHLTFDLGDPGLISASFLAKVPGPTMELGQAQMTFRYEDSFCGAHALEAYERLIHDALIGDRTLFTRGDGIERLWEISMPVLSDPPPIQLYDKGSWGPDAVHELIAPRRWHLPHEHA